MSGPRLRQAPRDGGREAAPGGIGRRSAGVRHQIGYRLQCLEVRPEGRTQATAHAIARHGGPEMAGSCNRQSGASGGSRCGEQNKVRAGHAIAVLPHTCNIGRATKSVAAIHGRGAAGKPLCVASVSGLDRQSLATLTPSATENRAPGAGGHARAKAMLTLPLANLGLIRAFHRGDKARLM